MIGKLVTTLIIQLALIHGELDFAIHIQGKLKKCQVSFVFNNCLLRWGKCCGQVGGQARDGQHGGDHPRHRVLPSQDQGELPEAAQCAGPELGVHSRPGGGLVTVPGSEH